MLARLHRYGCFKISNMPMCVCTHMYVLCVHTHMCVFMCEYVWCIHTCTCVLTHVYMLYIHAGVCSCMSMCGVYIHKCMCVLMHVHMLSMHTYVCACVLHISICMYVYVCIVVYTFKYVYIYMGGTSLSYKNHIKYHKIWYFKFCHVNLTYLHYYMWVSYTQTSNEILFLWMMLINQGKRLGWTFYS